MLKDLKHAAVKLATGLAPMRWPKSGKLRVLIETSNGFEPSLWLKSLDDHCPDWKSRADIVFAGRRFQLMRAAQTADVCSLRAIGSKFAPLKNLRWINLLSAGLDGSESYVPPAGVLITSSRGIAAASMAEHAITLFFAIRAKLEVAIRNQIVWSWDQRGHLVANQPVTKVRAAVVGLGFAGFETCRLCRALGMHVTGFSSHHIANSDVCNTIYPRGKIEEMLPTFDVVFLTLALSADTKSLFGETKFNLMKKTAILINVARGDLIQEEQLAQALLDGTIAGAGLDVLAQEPPGANSPLKHCPNLIITPHVSGNINLFNREITDRFARNIAAFVAGDLLEGLVPPNTWAATQGSVESAKTSTC